MTHAIVIVNPSQLACKQVSIELVGCRLVWDAQGLLGDCSKAIAARFSDLTHKASWPAVPSVRAIFAERRQCLQHCSILEE